MLGRGLGAPGSTTNSTSASTGQRAPSFRVPGASVAARAAAATMANGGDGGTGANTAGAGSKRANSAAMGGGGSVGAAGADDNKKVTVDADGFQTVTSRRGWRRARSTDIDGDGDATTGTGDGGAMGAGGAGSGPPGSNDDDDEDADEGPPTAAELHQAWRDEMAVVKRLRQQGIASDHPAMEAACKARDDAERAWRDNKDPTPPSVRLSRAQAKLDRAISLQADSRQAIIDLEKAHRAQLAVLQGKLDEDMERVRARRQQLEVIQNEVATGGRGCGARAVHGDAVRQVHTAICSTVAPTIAALIDQLDSASPAWSALNGILGTLADSKSLLEKAIPTAPTTQSFDIADDGRDDVDVEGRDDCDDSDWSESHELRGGDGHEGQDSAAARGGAAATGHGDDWGQDHSMETDEWWGMHGGGDWSAGVRWEACGHGKWTRTSWADSWEREYGEESTEPAHPPAARRRLEPAAPPTAPVAEAGGETAAAAAALDATARKLQHNERAQKIVLAAIEAGVQPLSASGEELHLLDPNQLDAWAAENLPSDRQYW